MSVSAGTPSSSAGVVCGALFVDAGWSLQASMACALLVGIGAWSIGSQSLWQQSVNQLFLMLGAYFFQHPYTGTAKWARTADEVVDAIERLAHELGSTWRTRRSAR